MRIRYEVLVRAAEWGPALSCQRVEEAKAGQKGQQMVVSRLYCMTALCINQNYMNNYDGTTMVARYACQTQISTYLGGAKVTASIILQTDHGTAQTTSFRLSLPRHEA